MKAVKKKINKKISDKVIREFEATDLGSSLAEQRTVGRWGFPKQRTKPTSIALTEDTIQVLRQKAHRKGIGYQTLLKMIVQEHLHEY